MSVVVPSEEFTPNRAATPAGFPEIRGIESACRDYMVFKAGESASRRRNRFRTAPHRLMSFSEFMDSQRREIQ